MDKIRYISDLTKEEVDANVVIPCIDDEGKNAIIIKNKDPKTIGSSYSTDNLVVKQNMVFKVDDEDVYCHIIISKKNDPYYASQFNVIYEYVFKKFEEPVMASELALLINSLEEYFKATKDSNSHALQIGVFGELLTLKNLYEAGYEDILDKYHEDFYSKHDVEIDERMRLEIKTTVNEKRIHHFRHNQICRKDLEVYVSSVMLEQCKEGYSLYQLFNDVLHLYSDKPDFVFALQKLMKKCNCDETDQGIIISKDKAYNDIKFFNAKELPQLNIEEIDTVSHIEYDVDCSFSNDLNVSELINRFLQ